MSTVASLELERYPTTHAVASGVAQEPEPPYWAREDREGRSAALRTISDYMGRREIGLSVWSRLGLEAGEASLWAQVTQPPETPRQGPPSVTPPAAKLFPQTFRVPQGLMPTLGGLGEIWASCLRVWDTLGQYTAEALPHGRAGLQTADLDVPDKYLSAPERAEEGRTRAGLLTAVKFREASGEVFSDNSRQADLVTARRMYVVRARVRSIFGTLWDMHTQSQQRQRRVAYLQYLRSERTGRTTPRRGSIIRPAPEPVTARPYFTPVLAKLASRRP